MKKNVLSGVLTMLLMFFATVANASVTITSSGGWFESAYVEFSTDGSAYYNVYYSTNKSTWTKIDDQLVRKYGSNKGRADVLGITAGTYYIKVASVASNGKESSNTVSGALSVKAHDRGGFAHLNWSKGIGAYQNNGTLKSGANILYITKSNAKTITMTIPTASNKTASFTGLQTIIDAWTKAYSKGWSSAPLDIRILGTLSYADMDKFSSSAEGIQIKGATTYADCPITIEGVGNDAVVHGFGFLIRNLTDLELRNFAIMDCLDDCVSMDTGNSHIWVHNLDLFYGQAGSDADQKKGDGTSDKDTVWVRYQGKTLDGNVFDEVTPDRDSVRFTLNRVVAGWTEGIQQVGEGGTIELYVPAKLGYGERGNQGIEPNATLIFTVDLCKVAPFVEKEEEAK